MINSLDRIFLECVGIRGGGGGGVGGGGEVRGKGLREGWVRAKGFYSPYCLHPWA